MGVNLVAKTLRLAAGSSNISLVPVFGGERRSEDKQLRSRQEETGKEDWENIDISQGGKGIPRAAGTSGDGRCVA